MKTKPTQTAEFASESSMLSPQILLSLVHKPTHKDNKSMTRSSPVKYLEFSCPMGKESKLHVVT